MHEAYDCGLIIKELREKAHMTQQELGRKINRDKGIISRYENNYQAVPFETMRVFASIFNVSMDYLAGMEKKNSIDATGLTQEQIQIVQLLVQTFRESSLSNEQNISSKQYELMGKIVFEMLKSAKG